MLWFSLPLSLPFWTVGLASKCRGNRSSCVCSVCHLDTDVSLLPAFPIPGKGDSMLLSVEVRTLEPCVAPLFLLDPTPNLSKSCELSLQNTSRIHTSIATTQPCRLSPGHYKTLHARFLLSVFAFPRVCPQLSRCHVLSYLSHPITPLPRALLWLPLRLTESPGFNRAHRTLPDEAQSPFQRRWQPAHLTALQLAPSLAAAFAWSPRPPDACRTPSLSPPPGHL